MRSLEPKGIHPRLGSMKRHRTSLGTTALLVSACALIGPSAALAGGPLLSGYGGPGAGSQAIIGAALLNGPSGGSGGNSSGGGSAGNWGGGSGGGSTANAGSGASGVATTAGGGSLRGGATTAGGGSARGSGRGSSGRGNRPAGGGSGQATGGGSGTAGVHRTSSQVGASVAASIGGGASWFSSADLLALLLAAGALTLTALATVRLARHHP